ncbi:hypothetical protein VTL71DRAFT_5087 [Oculimacula yallundae]|uniref:Uncharacterized protein n=1 Tax=Oculimacula yallundae TaxID=86028 RepID=A0ABR4C0S2_9HELO
MSHSMSYPEYYPKLLEFVKTQEPPSGTDDSAKTRWTRTIEGFEASLESYLDAHTNAHKNYDLEVEDGNAQLGFLSWLQHGNCPQFALEISQVQTYVAILFISGQQAFGASFPSLLSENSVSEDEVDYDMQKHY